MANSHGVVTVTLQGLENGTVPFSALESAFGPSSHGILIVDGLDARFVGLRTSLLSYASYLAQLPLQELDAITDAASHYEVGWSHGKEKLKADQYDTSKGSFYVNCRHFYGPRGDPTSIKEGYHSRTASNHWPSDAALPGFRQTFEDLCTLIIDVGALVARSCDRYATELVPNFRPGSLEQMVKASNTTKARLLHYFPPETEVANHSSSPSLSASDTTASDSSDDDSWCATHVDDGCLTALTSALYIDESLPFPPLTAGSDPSLAALSASPDPSAGLYIRSRTDSVVKINIPSNCLAFQTGEALQLMTGGRFKAVPHFVRGPEAVDHIARNTLAIFMQPDLEEVIDATNGVTFGEFANSIAEKHS